MGAPRKRHDRRKDAVTSPSREKWKIFCNYFKYFLAIPRRAGKNQIAVATPWDRGRVWQGLDRRKNAAVGSGVCTETPRSVWRRHCVSTASSRRVYGVCTAPKPNIIYCIAPSRRPRRAAAAITAIPWCYHGVFRRLQGVCRAFARRWYSDHSSQLKFTKENGTQDTFVNV